MDAWHIVDRDLNVCHEKSMDQSKIKHVVELINLQFIQVKNIMQTVPILSNYDNKRGCFHTVLMIDDFFNYKLLDRSFGIIWQFISDISFKDVKNKILLYSPGIEIVICIEIIVKHDLEPIVVSGIIKNKHTRTTLNHSRSRYLITPTQGYNLLKSKTNKKECCVCKKQIYNVKLCSRCMTTRYCSKSCQNKDYIYHKKACIELCHLLFI